MYPLYPPYVPSQQPIYEDKNGLLIHFPSTNFKSTYHRTHVPCPSYPCTVPMNRTHRTHLTYPVSDRSSSRFFKYIFRNVLKRFNKNRFYLKKSVARSVASWVRMVGTVGTVHGYDGYGTWVMWYMSTVHGYRARTQTSIQHPYPHPTTVQVPNTNSRNRTQQPYPTTVPNAGPVPNTRTQRPHPHPTPVPNTRTRTRTYRNDPPYPT